MTLIYALTLFGLFGGILYALSKMSKHRDMDDR